MDISLSLLLNKSEHLVPEVLYRFPGQGRAQANGSAGTHTNEPQVWSNRDILKIKKGTCPQTLASVHCSVAEILAAPSWGKCCSYQPVLGDCQVSTYFLAVQSSTTVLHSDFPPSVIYSKMSSGKPCCDGERQIMWSSFSYPCHFSKDLRKKEMLQQMEGAK